MIQVFNRNGVLFRWGVTYLPEVNDGRNLRVLGMFELQRATI